MSVPGHVENGVVVFDAGMTLPEGTKVTIAPVTKEQTGGQPNKRDWETALQAAHDLENYDYDAWRRQRDHDLEHAQDHRL